MSLLVDERQKRQADADEWVDVAVAADGDEKCLQ